MILELTLREATALHDSHIGVEHITLEFLGPLAVALATSRRRADLACALVAGAGVVALTRRGRPPTISASAWA
jgi:threonine/homoserine efflux transporter RhtA